MFNQFTIIIIIIREKKSKNGKIFHTHLLSEESVSQFLLTTVFKKKIEKFDHMTKLFLSLCYVVTAILFLINLQVSSSSPIEQVHVAYGTNLNSMNLAFAVKGNVSNVTVRIYCFFNLSQSLSTCTKTSHV